MMLQIKFKGLAIQLQSPFFCANSNTQRVMHDQPPARKLFQILLHFGKSARYFSKLDTAPQDARKPFICPNISHNLPLCPVSNLIFQTSILRALWIFSAQKHLSNHSSKCVEIEAARFFCKVKCDWQILPRKLFKTCLLLRRPPQANAKLFAELTRNIGKIFRFFQLF